MAKKAKKSGLAAKIRKNAPGAVERVRDNETRVPGGGDLPAGIENGIAQVTSCKFDTYDSGDNKGEYYCIIQATVVAPKKHEGIHIEGRNIMKMFPICDTKYGNDETPMEENIDRLLNQFRLLGLDTSEVTEDDLEDLAESLEELSPAFEFRTWQRKPRGKKEEKEAEEGKFNPRVSVTWSKAVDYEPEDDDGIEADDSDDVEDDVEDSEELDYSSMSAQELAEIADDDVDAQKELTKRADKLGLDAEEYEEWGDVADAIEQAAAKKSSKKGKASSKKSKAAEPEEDEEDEEEDDEGSDEEDDSEESDEDEEESDEEESDEDEEDEEEDEESSDPEKGDICSYKPPKSKKAKECEITSVNVKKETVSLKTLDDGKVFKNVSWEDIELT